MYKEKARVSKLETIIKRMNNGMYYESQKELMRDILKVLCANKKETKMYSMKWNSDYNYSRVAFEDADNLLKLVGLKRSNYGTIVFDPESDNYSYDECNTFGI
tara:strand:- start:531 stop:839 length:309 start_codon:yes stop_codon:yes gene_type:complete